MNKKVIEIEFRNGDTIFKRIITTGAKEMPLNKVLGTVLTDLFRLIDLQKNRAVNLFKLSLPFDMRVSCEGVTIDTTKIRNELKTKFKLNASPKRKRNFAKAVTLVLQYATTQTRVTTVERVIDNLETEIVALEVENA